ncbi:MAG: class I SAM-dependent methyltransferase [Caldimonas sp.]
MSLGLMGAGHVPAPVIARTFDYAAAAKESVACALCGQVAFQPLASIDRYGMGLATVGCLGCGLVQTRPRLTAASFDAFYRNDYRAYYQGVVEPSEGYVRQMKKGARLDATVAFLQGAGVLDDALAMLDVGCSEGTLFKALRGGGFTGPLLGVEPNDAFRAYASEQHGADTVASEAAMPARWRGKVGLVSMIHVLEHVADPVATLSRLTGFLAPGGHIYVDVPDVGAYSSLNDLHVAHVYHFSQATLRQTLEAAGLSVVRLEAHRPPGHPPSLRAIAAGGLSAAPNGSVAAPRRAFACDRTGWSTIRIINRQRFRLAVKRGLRRLRGRPEGRA